VPQSTESLAFETVYRTHVKFVWRSLLRLGVRESDVADAAQEVFVVVHRKLNTFEGRSKITRWLFAICVRVAKDRRQAAHVRRETVDGDLMDRLRSQRHDAAAEVERRQGLQQLQALLESMPSDQCSVFVLFELEGMTGVEVAELLDVPVATVHSRLRLARQSFQRGTERLRAEREFQFRQMGGPR
jgi:RNA polymerase sigma-70 factor, ECF subfamily